MEDERMSMSCIQCRDKKLKCDRVAPRCSRCERMGETCEFPLARRTKPGRPKQVAELEAKLAHLEERLATLQSGRQTQEPKTDTIEEPPLAMTADNFDIPEGDDGLDELDFSHTPHACILPPSLRPDIVAPLPQSLPPDLVIELSNTYFDKIQHAAPMIHRDRYMASLSQSPATQPPLCLQFIIMAMGARVSQDHRSLATPLYERAKAYAKCDETMIEGDRSIAMAHVQCWTLISNFQAQQRMFAQASTSLCHSIRAAQMLNLHQLDHENDEIHSALDQDIISLEEERRTWWVLYISDRLVCGVTGLPMFINAEDISTRLPATEDSFSQGQDEPTSTLDAALNQKLQVRSLLGMRVLAAHLYQQTWEHTSKIDVRNPAQGNKTDYWTRHCELDNDLSLLLTRLTNCTRLPQYSTDQNVISVKIQLHAAIIGLHRAATWRLRYSGDEQVFMSQQIAQQKARQSQERLLYAAEEIAHTLRMTRDSEVALRNPILNHAVYLACLVFIEDFMDKQDPMSKSTAQYLHGLLTTIDEQNTVAKSLAAQVAKDMAYAGITPPADLDLQPEQDGLFAVESGLLTSNVAFRLVHRTAHSTN